MIKNLSHQNKLILSLFSKGFKPTFKLGHNNELNFNVTEIKSHSGLINNTLYTFAYDNKKRHQKTGSKSHKEGEKGEYKKYEQIRPSQKELREKEKEDRRSFTPSITDPELFIDYINNKNRIEDAIKLMNRILNTNNLTKDEFEMNVWKKYSYYVYLVGEKEEERWLKENGIEPKEKNKNESQENPQQEQEEEENFEEENDNISEAESKLKTESQEFPDNHKMARLAKAKRLRLQFLSQITEIHMKFKGELQSQNVTKTFNKFVDFFFQKQQWSTLTFSEKISLIESLSRYNIKKAKTLFLKKRPSLFMQPKKQISQFKGLEKEESEYEGTDLVKVLNLMSKLEINDTQLFEKCIDLLYDEIDRMSLLLLEEVSFLLGKSHKFVNKDFLVRVSKRFNQLINQFDDATMIRALHILSSLSMIEKNMNLSSTYFEPLDIVYERMLPVFDGGLMKRIKSKYLSTIASTLRRSQYYDETILNSLISECMGREVYEFSVEESQIRSRQPYKTEFTMVNIGQLSQIFFCLGSFNYRHAEFMKYFLNILKLVQSSPNPEKYISYPLFSRLLWSMCVLCNEREIEELLPLLQHFYKNNKQVEPYEATNYYYCYLLLKRKYMLSDIRFENDKIQQYLSGPKHEVQISEIQKQVHSHLLELGIPSLLEYNLNNIICDIYIPKFHSLEHIIIEIHGYHHFPRNVKRLNGATTLKEKIIENEGYTCFYISLDEWLIAEDKEQFLKDFFNHILIKKHQEKTNSKLLQDSVKITENVQRRGRRVLEFKRKTQKPTEEIENKSEEILKISNKEDN